VIVHRDNARLQTAKAAFEFLEWNGQSFTSTGARGRRFPPITLKVDSTNVVLPTKLMILFCQVMLVE
jgi:hypothetical protein